ncbi:xanthine dehydrogenase accessory protein XdhC [Neoasaia chiangmaiensis]|uniref:Xanthine dehydrogenase accessory protein XdhC n=1 Tax=Neoasaia chiangmaiensis TaxID=320497 RepID=A0A1U9KUI1_9PROT|nr:xanthine dehydrogenase accessory protein XdhC [Neoasaia chiangmaiensis]
MTALEAVRRWRSGGQAVARVTIVAARGSTPRECGAFMLVTAREQSGTIGGGRLEWDCVAAARSLLVSGGDAVERDIVLGPRINQCCGGAVRVRIERLHDLAALETDMAQLVAALPQLFLFGAGHVGRALARALSLLPLRLNWIDAREEEFGDVPKGVATFVTTDWERELARAPAGSGVIVMTQSHTLDALIVAAALSRGDLRYVGLIGSTTKRRRFVQGFREIGIPAERVAALVCPIGDRGVRDKRPESIAALVAAEMVERFLN